METERRALYTSLRINWLADPTLRVESWQVENLRDISTTELLGRLSLTQAEFLNIAESFDTPEEMSQEENDPAYLVIFELWRRLLPEKPSLSIFCEELDHQIYLYDTDRVENDETFQDTLNQLLQILNDNADNDLPPQACMESICSLSAHDVEAFLYGYFSDELDQENFLVVRDLAEGFYPFIQDKSWFDFILFRLKVQEEKGDLEAELQNLLKNEGPLSLDFYLEILSFLTHWGDIKTYCQVSKKALFMIETEEDFSDFIQISADFYHFLDSEDREKQLLDIVKTRKIPYETRFDPNDSAFQQVKKIIFS